MLLKSSVVTSISHLGKLSEMTKGTKARKYWAVEVLLITAPLERLCSFPQKGNKEWVIFH